MPFFLSRAIIAVASILWCVAFEARGAEPPQKTQVFELSNDGEATLLVRTPNYRSAANPSEHLGTAAVGTRVELLESRPDPALAIFHWSRVRVLSGRLEGTTGWVSSRTLVKANPEPGKVGEEDRLKRQIEIGQPLPPDLESASRSHLLEATPLYPSPNFRSSEQPSTPTLSKGTLVDIQDEASDSELKNLLPWYKVQVLEGPHQETVGWLPAAKVKEATTKKRIVVNLNRKKLLAYEGEKLIHELDCLTGRAGHETVAGKFKITRKDAKYVSKKYKTPMPYSMFFDEKDGKAIHASHTWGIGTPAMSYLQAYITSAVGSHGCVGLTSNSAKTLFEWTPRGTPVEIVEK